MSLAKKGIDESTDQDRKDDRVLGEVPSVHLLATVGFVLVASQLAGRAARSLNSPRVTGYLVAGLLIGPSVLGLVSEQRVARLDILIDVALAVIAFLIGGSLRIARLRPLGRSIFTVTAGETVGAFAVTVPAAALVIPLITGSPYWGDAFWRSTVPMALVLGAVAVASAPAAILAIVHEYRADGPTTRTLLGVVAMDDAVGLVLFAFMLNVADVLSGAPTIGWLDSLWAPVAHVGVSVAIGAGAGWAMKSSTRLFPGKESLLAVTVGGVLLVGGAAESVGGSSLLANMAFGAVVTNAVRRQERLFRTVEDVEELVFGAFFVLAGAHLDLSVVKTAGMLGVVLLLARLAGKVAGASTGARIAGAPSIVQRNLGLALMPQAGVAVGLVLRIQGTGVAPEIFDLVLAGVLTSVLINELITPFAVRFGLRRAGEIAARKPRQRTYDDVQRGGER